MSEFKPTEEQIKNAISAAVSALYFDDSSDFLSALWTIVGELGGQEAVDLLEKDEQSAYKKYCV
jgi:hypothetical protein